MHGVGSTGFVIVLGSWFCNRWLKKWLQSRGVSNAFALPWVMPWLQPVVGSSWFAVVVNSARGGWKIGSSRSFPPCGWMGVWKGWFCSGLIATGMLWVQWVLMCVVRNWTHPRRSKCMVLAALASWRVLGSWFCNMWLKKWFISVLSALWLNGTMGGKIMSWFNSYGHDLTHPRRSKCMVSAALASWIVLGSCFCNRWLKKWLQSRGVSNALALPWATPWLQPVVGSSWFAVVVNSATGGWKNGSSVSGTGAGKELSRLALAAPVSFSVVDKTKLQDGKDDLPFGSD